MLTLTAFAHNQAAAVSETLYWTLPHFSFTDLTPQTPPAPHLRRRLLR